MQIRGLRVFVGVIREGSLALAARQMNISQPAASRLLRLFEEAVGTPLFTRDRQRLTVTPAGEALYPEAARILAALDDMPLLVNEAGKSFWHPLRIVSQPRVLDGLVMPAVVRLTAKTPEVPFKIEVYPRRYMAVRLSRGAFDIGISTMPVPTENVEVLPFSRVAICAILPLGHPLAGQAEIDPRALAGERYIALDETTAIRRLVEARHPDLAGMLKVHHEVSSTFTAIQMVRFGMGFTFVDPTAMEPSQLAEVAIVPLVPRTELEIAIFLPRLAHVHPARAAFIRLLREVQLPGLHSTLATNTP